MIDGLHVLDVVFEAEELSEAEGGENFHGGFLFADELGLDFAQAKVGGDFEEFLDHGFGQAAAAIIGVHENADASDVAFPSAQLLVQGGIGNDGLAIEGQEGEVAAVIDILAPVANDGAVGDAVLDEHALALRDGQEELVQRVFILVFEGTKFAGEIPLEVDLLREWFEERFQHRRSGWQRD